MNSVIAWAVRVRLLRWIGLTACGLCVGLVLAAAALLVDVFFYPEHPNANVGYRIILVLWIVDVARHVYLWLSGQLK